MSSDVNKTTRFEYNLDGNMTKLIAENPTTGDQVTEWIYGVDEAQGSLIASKALVRQKVYPDSTGATDRVTYTYNRQGQVTTMTDQAATVHGYAYDKYGRITSDAVTFPTGSTLDQTVKKISRSYEVRGMLERVGSIGTGTTVLNEVQLAYNAYGQLAKDYQEHNGPVNTSSTLFVGYNYADGSANTVRRIGITYPDTQASPTGATIITTAYTGTAADALSRPDAIKDGSDTLCSYRYLGAGVFIGVKYDGASNVELTYEDGGTGDAGDKYTGLDRFGRLIETLWKKGTAAQVHSQYGRNRFGGVTWRKDLAAHAQGVDTEDNFYQYDGLYQVKEHKRGNLTGTSPFGITNLQQEEDWTYDATGNWESYTNSNPTSSQTRTNNKANEITSITNPGGTMAPTYDLVGNMLKMPSDPGTTTAQSGLKWDAWNRLVEVKLPDGTIKAAHTYDGAFRRLTLTSPVTNGVEIRHFYYNRQWRAVEERVSGATIALDRQYTWGFRDRWDLLRRKRSTTSSLDEVHFCLRDYLDPVALVGSDGLVKERYAYDAFGKTRFLAPDYASRSASTHGWDWLFHGEFRDAVTGLYNYGFRYYEAEMGRWGNCDPIREAGGTNLFSFVFNASVSSNDLLGLAPPPMLRARKCAITLFVGHSYGGARRFMDDFNYEAGKQKATGCETIAAGVISCPQESLPNGRVWQQPYYPQAEIPNFIDPSGDFAGSCTSNYLTKNYPSFPVRPPNNGGLNPFGPGDKDEWNICNMAYGFMKLLIHNWNKTLDEAERRTKPCSKCCTPDGVSAVLQCAADSDWVSENRKHFAGDDTKNCNAWAQSRGLPKINPLKDAPSCGEKVHFNCGGTREK